MKEIDQSATKTVNTDISSRREAKHRVQLQTITEQMKLDEVTIHSWKAASNWLTTYHRVDAISRNKIRFRNAVSLWLARLSAVYHQDTCPRRDNFNTNHAMCLGHSELRALMREALHYQKFKSKWQCKIGRTFLDIKLFHPLAPSYKDESLKVAYKKQEDDKMRACEDRVCKVVWRILHSARDIRDRRYGHACSSRLTDMLAEKKIITAMEGVGRLDALPPSSSLLRSAVLCLHNTRATRPVAGYPAQWLGCGPCVWEATINGYDMKNAL